MALDDEIDRLYQLPPDEFTAARNELAKRAGERSAEVRKLGKPPVAAWAVNQLYWRDRTTYTTLVEAADELRAAHRAVLAGKGGDLRFAGKDHEEAVERALKSTLRLLAESGHPVTDATRHAIAQTLRALPSDDPPGRLARPLAPGGFEMLAGIAVKGGGRGRAVKQPAPPQPATKRTAPADDRLAQAREEAAASARALREAEQEARRAEFEAARAARADARAGEELTEARADLEKAQQRLERAEAEAAEAAQRKKDADRAVAAAAKQVAAARAHASSAERTARKRAP